MTSSQDQYFAELIREWATQHNAIVRINRPDWTGPYRVHVTVRDGSKTYTRTGRGLTLLAAAQAAWDKMKLVLHPQD